MNYDLFRTINDWSGNSFADHLMKFFAKDVIFLVFLVFALLCGARLRDRDFRPVILAFAGLVATFIGGRIAEDLHSERRPFETHPRTHMVISHDPGQAFPSDHAIAAFGIALAVAAFMSLAWGAVLAAAALAIGFARVYVGVHYPGDIGGSLLVAVIGVGLVAVAARLLWPAAAAKPLVASRR